MTLGEQAALFEYIERHDKTPDNLPKAMVPAPKTLSIGEDGGPQRGFSCGEQSVVNSMVEKAAAILLGAARNANSESSNSASDSDSGGQLGVIRGLDVARYASLSMAVIRYEAPDGKFAPHVDHCGESLVFLATLGRTANFMVKGLKMEEKRCFKFESGDMLVFNASTRAGILHGVLGIDEWGTPGSSGELLATRFPTLQRHRYGVQCRMHFRTFGRLWISHSLGC